ncbi:hypothetical protein IKF92_00495 [Candidatus Saccharibacteria bacterium]|nr:hypothetical protein [Candidatus Saccharibacteria bacterium]
MKRYYIGKKCLFKKVLGRSIKYGLPAVAILALPFVSLPKAEAETCTTNPCNTTFEVNVRETLAVQITTPAEGATGDVNDFLRNKVSVDVSTNNANGFTASMYSTTKYASAGSNATDLTNNAVNTATIPTLSSYSTRSDFPTNRWGYSLGSASLDGNTYGETDAGSGSSRYYPLTASTSTPIKILEGATGVTTGSQNVYFGAKADTTKPAGTYENTVIISVVTGAIDSNTNPITPVNPATPNQTENTATYTAAPTGHATNGSTTYTYRRANTSGGVTVSNTTTTEVSEGNNVSAYAGYTPPQGVVQNTESNVSGGNSPLAAALATTASVAATSGLFFFVAAKRRKDDDDDEQQA